MNEQLVDGAMLLIFGLILWLLIRGRLGGIEQRIDGLEASLTKRIEGVEASLTKRIEGVEQRVDGLRSDLTQVALAVGARPPAEAGG